jgi:hypothetical protein
MCSDEGSDQPYCSATCTLSADCIRAGSPLALDCEVGTGECFLPCDFDETRGSGLDLEICATGRRFAPCSTQPPASACLVCGCEPFGGGTCIVGMGCVVPRANGEECTVDAQCVSGSCHRDTELCGNPRPMGDACTVDAECASSNCSTDGLTTSPGVCNQPLGSRCTGPMSGRNRTETCTNCLIDFGADAGICLREDCAPGTAPTCPSFAGHEFECALGADDTYGCFEVCEDEFDDCFYDSFSCYRAGDYCRS